jgi:hypothetical protein
MFSLSGNRSFTGFAKVGLNLKQKSEIRIGKLFRAAPLGLEFKLIERGLHDMR